MAHEEVEVFVHGLQDLRKQGCCVGAALPLQVAQEVVAQLQGDTGHTSDPVVLMLPPLIALIFMLQATKR